jgi:hypothetical protein
VWKWRVFKVQRNKFFLLLFLSSLVAACGHHSSHAGI